MKQLSLPKRIAIEAAATRTVRLLCVGAIALVMGACASLSEKECLSANWADQGYRDGRAGQPLARLEDHREACAKVGVVPDAKQYQVGRDRGVLEYCTPMNAVREGRLGNRYRNACPMQLESAFLAHHQLGLRVHGAQQRLDSLDRQVQQVQRSLDKEKNETRRRDLRVELRELDRRTRRARDELRDEERRLRF